MHRPEAPEVEGPFLPVGVVLTEVELPLQELANLVGHVGADLEAHRPAELTATQLDLHGGEEVFGLLLLEGEVGVAAHAERGGGLHVHPWEQLSQVCRDHLLQRHEPLPVGHHHEARQQVRHLDAGEPPLGRDGVAEEHRQVQARGSRCRGRGDRGRRRAA